jgi:NAD(P)-dependent dehydrogenase (short-subunit alcohol dehydrogenase family)
MHVDVGTLDGVRGMVERAVGLWGRLDIVVSNAYSGVLPGDAVGLSEEHCNRAMDVGIKAMFRAAKYAVPHMPQTGGGWVMNLSSVHGLLVAPGWLAYMPGHSVTERIRAHWDAHPDWSAPASLYPTAS